jgi:hypothetical protein
MASVPYKGVPEVAPEDRAAPYFHLNAVADAFGANIGSALSHLGSQIERSSDELFGRAVALQKLRNETEADEAISKYMVQSAPLRAEFNSKQGRDAVDSLKPHIAELDALRMDIRKGLTNQDAQRRYDASSRGFMGREIFSASGHSATENKRWANSEAKAGIDPLFQQIQQNPNDQNVFDTNINEINTRIDQQAAIGGWGPDQTNREKALHYSLALAHRIEAVAQRGDPVKARQMLEENRDKILSQHRNHVENVTQSQLDNTGARVIADNVRSGWAPYMKPSHVDRAAAVDRTLVSVVQYAQKLLEAEGIRVTIGAQGGKRTTAEQEALYAIGRRGIPGERPVTWTKESDHLHGRAIDLEPMDKKDANDAGYAKIAKAMVAASARLGISLAEKSATFAANDPGHFSLAKDFDVKNAPKQAEPTERELVERGERYAKQLFPDNTLFHDYTRQRISSGYNELKRQRREAETENLNTVYDAIMGNRSQGKVPTSVEELTMDPQVNEAFNNLEPPKQFAMLKRMENVANSQRRESSELEGRRLRGMAINSPAEFLKEDVLSNEKISYAEMKSLLSLQGQIRKNPDQRDPQVQRALSVSSLGPKLRAAGLTKADRPDDYNAFIGTLQDVIVEHMKENNNKPPTIDELKTIGNRLLQEFSEPGAIWGNLWPNKYSIFNHSLPSKELDKVRQDYMDKHPKEPPPDDESLQREYRLQLYESLFKGKGKPQGAPKAPSAGAGLGIGNE